MVEDFVIAGEQAERAKGVCSQMVRQRCRNELALYSAEMIRALTSNSGSIASLPVSRQYLSL